MGWTAWTRLTPRRGQDGYRLWRVSGGDELCPRIYDLARRRDWRLAELRPAPRTLESVFRDLVDHPNAGAWQ